jgi:hypothetical protein
MIIMNALGVLLQCKWQILSDRADLQTGLERPVSNNSTNIMDSFKRQSAVFTFKPLRPARENTLAYNEHV